MAHLISHRTGTMASPSRGGDPWQRTGSNFNADCRRSASVDFERQLRVEVCRPPGEMAHRKVVVHGQTLGIAARRASPRPGVNLMLGPGQVSSLRAALARY